MTETKVKGWVEILLRLNPLEALNSEDDLDQDDYAMFGSRIPLEEFDNVFGAYLMYREPGGMLPREIRRYDVINIITTHPAVRSISRLMITEEDISVLGYKGAYIETLKAYPLKILPMRRVFPSFLKH